MSIPVIPNRCVCKITISETWSYHQVRSTIYYRSGMSPDFVVRWRWYFDYLASLVKVHNPHRNVVIRCDVLPDDILLGKEWHDYRRDTMLKTARRRLAQLENAAVATDIFGFAQEDHARDLASQKAMVEALEADTYPIPDFPSYINRIKEFL